MRSIVGLWRWRRNPVRRGTDLVEAWTALITVVLIVLLCPVAGLAAGNHAHDALQQTVDTQIHVRHRLVATVVKPDGGPRVDSDPETSTARDSHSRVLADWKAPDGTQHRGKVLADLSRPRTGDHFELWTDRRGRIVGRPLDGSTAGAHAVLAGLGTAAATGVVLEGARRLLLWRSVRRRYDQWDSAWAKTGPDWGRAGAGSE
ncbi:Rv1733c family protein [Streptomyces tsukubensis]|uniref:Integral membrane protein n=1 Tax=Streptomyces tsukubensis TaxID=83656 RepID=A0A1V3ZZ17_9ACTN|nr:hypothetical protein [Streptomyces tsukubensis]OON71387.1 hypothetical protein B1H18_34085 [Streptomyces tsukubensis]QFR97058.1 hypothetical protein GBW32_33360 [Streptomyces tsukubensis]